MKLFVKAALGALALAPLALANTTPAQARVDFGINLGVPVAPAPAYVDPCYDPRFGGPAPACAYPYYGGDVFIDGAWVHGPRYRDFHGHREFWHNGGWHEGRGR